MKHRRSQILVMDEGTLYVLAKELNVKDASMMGTTEMRNHVIGKLVASGELIEDDGSTSVAGPALAAVAASSPAPSASPARRPIMVSYPPFDQRPAEGYAGKTVGDLHHALREAWSMEAKPRIYLTRDGTVIEADMSTRLKDGDALQFAKTSAEKGRL